ncbi:MAG: hypothetical protein ACRC6M_10220, partial [Microcystaceae cyanobacterium]
MSYLIAVITDRIKAEEAYTALEAAGIKQSQMAIVGTGYKSSADFPFIDPKRQARKQALFMAVWLVPFGFFAGF